MSRSASDSQTLSTASQVATFVSLLPAFSPQAREPAFLPTVRRRAAGRPLPLEARSPSLRAHALDLVADLWTALLDDCRTGIELRESTAAVADTPDELARASATTRTARSDRQAMAALTDMIFDLLREKRVIDLESIDPERRTAP